jgi:hypothetical protein
MKDAHTAKQDEVIEILFLDLIRSHNLVRLHIWKHNSLKAIPNEKSEITPKVLKYVIQVQFACFHR